MLGKTDDLEAVRKVADALQGFDATEQERILRWARERVGLSATLASASTASSTSSAPPATAVAPSAGQQRDLRAFVAAKSPTSDIQFAATVAYYFRFEAPESDRKDAVNSDDLLDACRKAGRNRLQNPGQTLRNAHQDGLLDRAEPGAFSINAVGENLVAMALPSGSTTRGAKTTRHRPATRKAKKPAKHR